MDMVAEALGAEQNFKLAMPYPHSKPRKDTERAGEQKPASHLLGLAFLIFDGVSPVGLCGLCGVASIFFSVASARALVSSSE